MAQEMWESLPDPIDQFAKIENRTFEIVGALRGVFYHHNMQNIAGGALLHRHFDMKKDEVLVERFRNGNSYTSPKNVLQVSKLVPHLWKLAKSEKGEVQLLAIEYIEPDAETPDFEYQCKELTQNKEFIESLYNTLEVLGILDVVGLQLVHRESLRVDGKQLLERTDLKNRTSIVTATFPVEITEKVIPTFFPFHKMDDKTMAEIKADGCGNHGWDFCSRFGNSCCCE
jgi:hypothetical protein